MINLLKTNDLQHFILTNKLTKIKEVLTYSELQNRINKNNQVIKFTREFPIYRLFILWLNIKD